MQKEMKKIFKLIAWLFVIAGFIYVGSSWYNEYKNNPDFVSDLKQFLPGYLQFIPEYIESNGEQEKSNDAYESMTLVCKDNNPRNMKLFYILKNNNNIDQSYFNKFEITEIGEILQERSWLSLDEPNYIKIPIGKYFDIHHIFINRKNLEITYCQAFGWDCREDSFYSNCSFSDSGFQAEYRILNDNALKVKNKLKKQNKF